MTSPRSRSPVTKFRRSADALATSGRSSSGVAFPAQEPLTLTLTTTVPAEVQVTWQVSADTLAPRLSLPFPEDYDEEEEDGPQQDTMPCADYDWELESGHVHDITLLMELMPESISRGKAKLSLCYMSTTCTMADAFEQASNCVSDNGFLSTWKIGVTGDCEHSPTPEHMTAWVIAIGPRTAMRKAALYIWSNLILHVNPKMICWDFGASRDRSALSTCYVLMAKALPDDDKEPEFDPTDLAQASRARVQDVRTWEDAKAWPM